MDREQSLHALTLMRKRFERDSVMSLTTVADGAPRIRLIDVYYRDGAFFAVTHALSNKMRQIAHVPNVALGGDWFTAHGTAENLGWVRKEENRVLMESLRQAFAAWYDNGDTDETDENTIVLRVTLQNAMLLDGETRYVLDFTTIPSALYAQADALPL